MNFPNSVRLALYLIACDQSLVTTLKSISSSAEGYLDEAGENETQIVKKLRRAVDSIQHAHEFLREYEVNCLIWEILKNAGY